MREPEAVADAEHLTGSRATAPIPDALGCLREREAEAEGQRRPGATHLRLPANSGGAVAAQQDWLRHGQVLELKWK